MVISHRRPLAPNALKDGRSLGDLVQALLRASSPEPAEEAAQHALNIQDRAFALADFPRL